MCFISPLQKVQGYKTTQIVSSVLYELNIHFRDVKDLQRPRLGKPRRRLQIFDTRVDFPVPESRFLYRFQSP